jgi:biopolymer transport protein ExbB/TolQ
VGLTGTIYGIIRAFSKLESQPPNGIIASGISNAVLVTFEGLVILLLALLSGSGFSIDNWAALRRKTVLARDYRERP